MKIGILTFHNAKNYGAILQAYALQKFLISNNINAEIIDYESSYIKSFYKLFSFKSKSLKNYIKQILLLKSKYCKFKKFDQFVYKYMILSDCKNIKKNEIKKYTDIYDKLLVGSDQVWNLNCTDYDLTYLLDFECKNYKKYSYAASFGKSNINEKDLLIFKKYLNEFNKISVRENDGKRILNDIGIKNVEVVVDPTLLLTIDEWSDICADRIIKDDYILVYSLYSSKKINNFAKKIANKYGIKIVVVQSDLKKEINNSLVVRDAGIEEFLSLIRYSKFVITNSFHGTIFSLIFNKDFFINLIEGADAPNSRLINLLEEYNLTHRILDYSLDNNFKNIDYKKVNNKIINNRKKSETFLLDFLKD